MSDINEQTQTNELPNEPTVGFCQNCGRGLNTATIRQVGQATYCEPCLAAKLAGAPAAGAGYTPVDAGVPPAGWAAASPMAPMLPGAPNPGLATILGFIPGVGAMYNGQYAKGIVHLVVFVVLISLTDAFGIFGFFIAGWEFYMAFDAHHTAKARRDGLPLPNPFGLNDIGERLGFGKAWPGAVDVAGVARDAAQTVTQGFSNAPTPQAGGWGAPNVPPDAAYQAQQQAAWQANAQQYAQNVTAQAYEQAHRDAFGGMPPVAPYTPVAPMEAGLPAVPPVSPSRFPAGAVWLIGLGVLFLLMTSGRFDHFEIHGLLGFGLIGLGVWTFIRRMTQTGTGFANDGTPFYQARLFRAIRSGVWLVLIGIWFLLDTFNILTFHRSWPLFLIVAGVLALGERLSFNSASTSPYGVPGYGQGTYPPVPPAPVATSNPGTAIVPSSINDPEKGR